MNTQINNRNLTMLTDFYQITMGNGYLVNNYEDREVVFDMFFRKVPDKGCFAIAAGLEQLITYLKNLYFTAEDIEFLRKKKRYEEEDLILIEDEKTKEKLSKEPLFDERFLEYLKNFKFECDVWAIPEGEPIFPNEPIVKIRGPIIQAQMIETMVLLTINHQSLIATKASRIVRAAKGKPVMEFGSRRAQGYDGAIYGARAACVAGCVGTSCTILERDFNIPAIGTMAHSWVQSFDSEYEAFKAYTLAYPTKCTLLVDTYNVLKSGIPNAIRVAKEILEPLGHRLKGIRIDSGDLTYLTIEARKMLDVAGLHDCKIVVSNSLDEYLIKSILSQGAQIDLFGVGERLITAKSDPVFGGVYKLVAIRSKETGELVPKIKLSENEEKITTPHDKELYRLYNKTTGKAIADVLAVEGESINSSKPYVISDPNAQWKKETITNFTVKKLLVPVFEKGKCVYESPRISEIQSYCKEQLNTIREEHKRFENPQTYLVSLSPKLLAIKKELLKLNTL